MCLIKAIIYSTFGIAYHVSLFLLVPYLCCTLSLLLKRNCILQAFQIMWNLSLPLVKVCNLLIKHLLNFSFLGAKCNLIITNLMSSNNHIGINSSSFSLLNLKKVPLKNLTGWPAFQFFFIRLIFFSKFVVSFSALCNSLVIDFCLWLIGILELQWTGNFVNFVNAWVGVLFSLIILVSKKFLGFSYKVNLMFNW